MVASIVAADDIELDGMTEQVALDSIVAEDDVELDGLTEQVDRGSQPIERVASRALGLSVAARGASKVSAPAARTVSSGNRFCANIVVKLADQARTSDNCLVAVRSRQRPPRPQRELRAQKVQSDY